MTSVPSRRVRLNGNDSTSSTHWHLKASNHTLHRCFEVLGVNAELTRKISAITGGELSDGDASTIFIASQVLSNGWQVTSRPRQFIGNCRYWELMITVPWYLERPTWYWKWMTAFGLSTTNQIRSTDPEMGFNNYRSQQECYSKLLNSMGYNVLGLGISWIRRGGVAFIRYERNDKK